MASVKQRTKFGYMAKVEAVYNVAETLVVGTDGVQLSALPEPNLDEYLYDGSRGAAPGSGGNLAKADPAGLQFSGPVEMQPVGFGAAYSAPNVPPGVHTMLRSAGCEALGSFTGGSEKYTYSPESGPTGFDSITVEAYVNGQRYGGKGVYTTFSIAIEGPGIPVWTFEQSGTGQSVPTDVAVPAITYPAATRIPPRAVSIGLSIGTGTPFTGAKVRGFTFTLNRELSPRADDNSTGHAGFTPGRRNPTFEVTIEQVTLATTGPWYTATTINPGKLKELMSANLLNVTLTVGSVQYNRWKLNMPTCQLVAVEDGEDGATSTWTLTFECKVSGQALDDDFNIVFD